MNTGEKVKMLTTETGHDHQVSEDGTLHVRKITKIMEDGTEITRRYDRHVMRYPYRLNGKEAEVTRCLAIALYHFYSEAPSPVPPEGGCPAHPPGGSLQGLGPHQYEEERKSGPDPGDDTVPGPLPDDTPGTEEDDRDFVSYRHEAAKKITMWAKIKDFLFTGA